MKDQINNIRNQWANANLAGDMEQGGNALPVNTVLLSTKSGEPLMTMRDLLVIESLLPEEHEKATLQSVEAPEIETNTPALGVDCVVWFNGEPRVDKLTDVDHHSPYWEWMGECFGDEDKFMVLPE